MRKVVGIVSFVTAIALVFGFSGCAFQDHSSQQDASTAANESTEPEIIVNEHVTVFTNANEPAVRERMGTDADVSTGTVMFSLDERKIVCRPNQDKVVVINGAEAMIDCDRSGICYKRADEYLRFGFENNTENVDPRFIVPDGAVEYKLGLDGVLREYLSEDGETYFRLDSDDTVRYFKKISEQDADYFGNDKYTTYIAEELGPMQCDDDGCITINLDGHELKNTLRILLVSKKHKNLVYLSRDDDPEVTEDTCCIDTFDRYVSFGRPDAGFTERFGKDTFVAPFNLVDTRMKDIYGNAICVELFSGDGRSKDRRLTEEIRFCTPFVPGISSIGWKISVALLFSSGDCPTAILTDAGFDLDAIEIYWDSSTESRVLAITVSSGGQKQVVYYRENYGYVYDFSNDLISWKEHVAEQS